MQLTSFRFAEIGFAEADEALEEGGYLIVLAGDDQADEGDLGSEEIAWEYLDVLGCVD
jgi:hypothetical protein